MKVTQRVDTKNVISLKYLEVGPVEMSELAPSNSGHDLDEVISTTE